MWVYFNQFKIEQICANIPVNGNVVFLKRKYNVIIYYIVKIIS